MCLDTLRLEGICPGTRCRDAICRDTLRPNDICLDTRRPEDTRCVQQGNAVTLLVWKACALALVGSNLARYGLAAVFPTVILLINILLAYLSYRIAQLPAVSDAQAALTRSKAANILAVSYSPIYTSPHYFV
jgi:hypothetical protein